MGNALGGGKKTAKVMKINGETMKFKTPIQAGVIVKDYPNHTLLDSESVKHYGIRAKPLDVHQSLEPKRLYFLVELPKFPQDQKVARRVRSGINMTAKDRLESLMLSRRSVSDLSIMRPASITVDESSSHQSQAGAGGGPTRVRMRLPKAEVERLMSQSKHEGEMAEKIMGMCKASDRRLQNGASHDAVRNRSGGGSSSSSSTSLSSDSKGKEVASLDQEIRRQGADRRREGYNKKRVGFLPINEAEIRLAVASS